MRSAAEWPVKALTYILGLSLLAGLPQGSSAHVRRSLYTKIRWSPEELERAKARCPKGIGLGTWLRQLALGDPPKTAVKGHGGRGDKGHNVATMWPQKGALLGPNYSSSTTESAEESQRTSDPDLRPPSKPPADRSADRLPRAREEKRGEEDRVAAALEDWPRDGKLAELAQELRRQALTDALVAWPEVNLRAAVRRLDWEWGAASPQKRGGAAGKSGAKLPSWVRKRLVLFAKWQRLDHIEEQAKLQAKPAAQAPTEPQRPELENTRELEEQREAEERERRALEAQRGFDWGAS